MFVFKYFTLVAFLPFINATITDQEVKDLFKIFVDTVNFSPGQGKASGVIKPLPNPKDLVKTSARLAVFVGNVRADVRGVLDHACGSGFDEVKTQTFNVNAKDKPLELPCAVARLYIAQELATLCVAVEKELQLTTGKKQVRAHQQSSIESYVATNVKVDCPFRRYWNYIKEEKPLDLMKHGVAFEDEKELVELNKTQFTILVRLTEWLGRPDNPENDVIRAVRDLEKDRAAFIETFNNMMKKLETEAKPNTNANQPPNGAESGRVLLRVINDKAIEHNLSWMYCPTPEELFEFAKLLAEESTSTSHKPPTPNPVQPSAKSTAGRAAAPGA
ncbi:hypothetical protein Ddc_12807 [Ditylenchus destructor]|nr:hypothetical protein Ddc_12807 [Ditylenchus destructor]